MRQAVLFLIAFMLGWLNTPSVLAASPPNIVFIMADDVGLGDIGFYHTQRTGKPPVAPTPNLDALARAGMRFSDAHSSTALCSPTRYCVMSGNLNHRSYAPWGVWGSFRKSPFTDRDATLGRIARQGGLATAFIGKWHLGGDFRALDSDKIYRGNDRGEEPLPVDVSMMIDGGPRSVGFDYSLTMPCGIQGPLYTVYENGRWKPFHQDSRIIHFTAETAGDPLYVSDKGPGMGDSHWDPRLVGPMLSAAAVDFIERESAAGKPFFLCYWSPMVHLPHVPPAEFDGRAVKGETPTSHLDMLIDLDQQVGRIVGALKDAGVDRETFIVFSSDNGGLYRPPGGQAGHDSSGGFRGAKNSPHEGGHRVPFFAVWRDVIEADSESDELIALHDLPATMAGVLGVSLGKDQAMDSLNLEPLFRGAARFKNRTDFLLQGGSRNELIYRQGNWKLIIQSNWKLTRFDPVALFDLGDNPLEKEAENLINDPAYAERVKAMLVRYLEIRRTGERTTPAMN